MKKTLPILMLLLSCSDTDNKLNESKFKIGDLEISRYQISLITSMHDYVDATKNGKTETILKVNTGDIDTIFLTNDTLVIKTFRQPVFYEKKDKVFNYYIKIDSVPSIVNDTIYGYPISPQKKINAVIDTTGWDSLKNSTVLSFLDKVIINKADGKQLNFITIEDDRTSSNWIKPQDIDTLIALIKSKKRCRCAVDPLSSYLPTNDYAELGGYAILFLKHYKDKREMRFSLNTCPKTNEKEAEELIKWWTQTKRK